MNLAMCVSMLSGWLAAHRVTCVRLDTECVDLRDESLSHELALDGESMRSAYAGWPVGAVPMLSLTRALSESDSWSSMSWLSGLRLCRRFCLTRSELGQYVRTCHGLDGLCHRPCAAWWLAGASYPARRLTRCRSLCSLSSRRLRACSILSSICVCLWMSSMCFLRMRRVALDPNP